MVKSKARKWGPAEARLWEEPANDVFPLVSRWKKQGYKKFLDLGCGVGRHAILFAEKGFDVSATDLSENALEILNKYSTKNNLQIKTQLADMISLPYQNESFDCLLAYHAIYHQDDEGIKQVISEIKRVLKESGEAYITFNSKKSSAYKSKDTQRLTENTIIKTKGREAGIPHFYADKEEVQKLLKDFKILKLSYKEYQDSQYTGAHYFVLVKK